MLKRLTEWLCKIDSDKYVHFIVCMLLSFFLGSTSLLFKKVWIALLIAFFAPIITGVIKELSDDHVDKKDLIADVIGTVFGMLLVLYAYWILTK